MAALIGGIFRSNIVQAGRTVSSGGGSAGGGAFADVDGEAFISSGVFVDNQVIGTTRAEYLSSETGSANGGAVYHGSGVMRVEGSLFERNTVLGGDGFNRGLNYRFSARGNGGALFNGTGQLDLRTSTLALNQALGGNGEGDRVPGVGGAGSGGGIFNLGQLTVVNCTLAQNLAKGGSEISQGFNGVSGGSAYGGAIFSESGEVLLLHATLAENAVAIGDGRGGQPEALGSSIRVAEGAVTLISTVLSCANTETNVSGAIIDGGHNLSSDASAGFTSESSRANLDPRLGPLAGNGGPTPTMALLPGSPAIDAGDDAAAPLEDQRGLGRPVGPHADIGAFEVGLSGIPRITTGPRDASVGAGQTVSFSVYVDTLPVSYQWQKDDADLPGATNAVLTLEKAQLSQAGQYRAIVSNPSGSVTSSSATLTVLPPTPPEILAQPEGQAIPAGQPLVLSVTATNLLPLRYQWQREGTDIPGARDPLLLCSRR